LLPEVGTFLERFLDGWDSLHLEQSNELFNRNTSAFDEAAQGAAIKLFMIRDGKMPAIGSVIDHVAALLVMEQETDFLKRFGGFPTRDDGKGGIRRRLR